MLTNHQWDPLTLITSAIIVNINLKMISLQFPRGSELHMVAYWSNMVTEILVNIGSGNGLLPDGMESLPETLLTIIGKVFKWHSLW